MQVSRKPQLTAQVPHDEYSQYSREAAALGISIADLIRARMRKIEPRPTKPADESGTDAASLTPIAG
jgi:hypothetical protein